VIRGLEGNLNGPTVREPYISDLFEIFRVEIGYDGSIGYAHGLKRVSRCLNGFAPPTSRPTGWRRRVPPWLTNIGPQADRPYSLRGLRTVLSRLSSFVNVQHLNRFGLRGAVYISRKRTTVDSFKRSSKMTKSANNEYAKRRLSH
jgi:hypothetical protein